MDADRCVCCGEIVPEGRMICRRCEREEMKYGAILQSQNATEEEVKDAYKWLYPDIKGDINDKETSE